MNDSRVVIDAFESVKDYDSTIRKEIESLTPLSFDQYMDRLVLLADPRAGEAILDVATGTALVAIALAQRTGSGAAITGVDITPGMLGQAAAKVVELGLEDCIELQEASGLALPLENDTVDLATCSMAMHHMHVKTALAEIIRVLKKGGRLVIADMGASPRWRTPAGRVVVRLLLFLYQLFSLFNAKSRAEAEAFSQCFTRAEWEEILAASGASEYSVEEQSKPGKTWYPTLLWIRVRK